ncbi:MAG: N-terminal phage integrase SAM-like domain-containing protein, partial [Actinomycetota bacterium]|nr:N-terminal phage integrase SAM-like domain-containing protein [Actinomycetota bacterium]
YDVRLRDDAGRVYNRTFLTKREAELYAARQRTDRSRGAWVDPRRGTVTVDAWAEYWLAQRSDLRIRTVELYTSLLRLHVLPELGAVELAKLSPSQVRSWHAGLRARRVPGPPPQPRPIGSCGPSCRPRWSTR